MTEISTPAESEANSKTTVKKEKIDHASATQEFLNWADINEIDIDEDGMNEDERSTFDRFKKVIVKSISRGRSVVEGTDIIYTPIDPDWKGGELRFTDPSVSNLMDGEKGHKNLQVKAAVKIVASVTKQSEVAISKMRTNDWSVCQSIIALFMAR